MRRDIQSILEEIGKVISGKHDVTEKIIMAMLAGGHILLDDVPGVGKTTLAIVIGKIFGMKYNRIQFTPDVMPSDIVGFSVYNRENNSFDYRPGILQGTNLLLGDEINRTSSRTQSALLEAMEEHQVTVDGSVHKMENPFIVIATQNTVGTAGTQLLPYAQMDRFLVSLSIGYPDRASQIEMLRNRQNRNPMDEVRQILKLSEFIELQKKIEEVKSSDSILEYITELTFATRDNELISLGLSPRAALFLEKMAKAKAFCEERDYVIPKDVRDVFPDVCAHRIVLSEKAEEEGTTSKEILQKILSHVKSPDSRK